jgi:hypothetical protein
MKKLYLVPVIHMSVDMGSMAAALDDAANARLTPEIWQRHKEIVSVFWDSVGRFLDSLNVNGFKVYQDGMIADGGEGLKVIREGVKQGSKNYEIISKLLERGAVLVKTESIFLVKQEYSYISKIARSRSFKEKEVAALRYKVARGNLLKQRDKYIAGRITETLSEGETGILFIGAYHNVIPRLDPDIKVGEVKEVDRVRKYHKTLINTGRCDQDLRDLGDYLASPICGISF